MKSNSNRIQQVLAYLFLFVPLLWGLFFYYIIDLFGFSLSDYYSSVFLWELLFVSLYSLSLQRAFLWAKRKMLIFLVGLELWTIFFALFIVSIFSTHGFVTLFASWSQYYSFGLIHTSLWILRLFSPYTMPGQSMVLLSFGLLLVLYTLIFFVHVRGKANRRWGGDRGEEI